jgi:hypothetical protein
MEDGAANALFARDRQASGPDDLIKPGLLNSALALCAERRVMRLA